MSYERLFGPYLKGASDIHIFDPYIRQTHQFRNLFEFLVMVLRLKPEGEEITVRLTTKHEYGAEEEVRARLKQIENNFEGSGITFLYAFDQSDYFHDREIQTNTGWSISLSRGLDIFQPFDFKNRYGLANHLQEYRQSKGCEIVFDPHGQKTAKKS